jgi:very-short-patch-repair endonuclease
LWTHGPQKRHDPSPRRIYHRGSTAFEDDHARDLDLRAAGYTVLRFTDRQLEEEPGRVAADVARALAEEVSSPFF